LIELMVTVAIIGILAAIAYPSYINFITHSNRAAAESFLLEVSAMQERFLVDNRAYATTLDALGYSSPPTTVSPNYKISITPVAGPPSGYALTATPQGAQAKNDAACGNLTLSNTGDKGISGSASASDCWR